MIAETGEEGAFKGSKYEVSFISTLQRFAFIKLSSEKPNRAEMIDANQAN